MKWLADKIAYQNQENFVKVYRGEELLWEKIIIPSGYKRVKSIYNEYNSSVYAYQPEIDINLPVSVRQQKFSIEMDLNLVRPTNKEYIIGYSNQDSDPSILNELDAYVTSSRLYMHRYNGDIYDNYYGNFSNFGEGTFLWNLNTRNIKWDNDNIINSYSSKSMTFSYGFITVLKSFSGAVLYPRYISHSKIYSIVIRDNSNNIIMTLIPVLNTTTGKAGLYDVVGNAYYGNRYESSEGGGEYQSIHYEEY